MSNISTNSSKTLIRQVFSILIQLASSVIIARSIGVESFGQYALAILLPTFMAMFLSLGLTASNVYYIGKKDFSLSTVYTSTMIVSMVIIVSSFFTVLFLLKMYGQIVFPSVKFDYLFIALLIFPFSFINSFHLSFLQAIEEFSMFNLISLFQPTLLFIIIMILSLFNNLDLKILLEAILITNVLLCVISTIVVFKHGFVFKWHNYSKKYVYQSVSYGLRAHISNLVAFVSYKADIFLLNFLSSPSSVGIYSLAVQIVEKLWVLSQSVSTVLFPRFVALKDKDKERTILIAKTFRIVMILTLLASIFLSIFGYYFILILFGENFLDAYTAILYLIPGVVFGAGSRILANAIAAKGKPELNMYTSIFAMLLNIILNIILIPYYGIVGAAVATSIAYIVNTLLRIWMFFKIEKLLTIKELYFTINDFSFIYIKAKLILNRKG